MQGIWYERAGAAREVLNYGEIERVKPGPGEIEIRIHASGVNPGDVKKRLDAFDLGLPYARIVPHSDGAGIVESVGEGVNGSWVGERVWCFGAQSYRPFGTAAEYCNVPESNVVRLPGAVTFEQGSLLGIPGITAYHALHVAGPVSGKTVLVQGGAGAVGSIAVLLAKRAGAFVIAAVRKADDVATVREAGAENVIVAASNFVEQVLRIAPKGVDHIVDVAFGANIAADERVLATGGSAAVYASDQPEPRVPFWPLAFKNISVHFLGSDDFPIDRKREAAMALTAAAADGWVGLPVGARFALPDTADAHVRVEQGGAGRVVIGI